MTDESNLEYLGQMAPKRLKSLAEEGKESQQEFLADERYRRLYGANRQKRSGVSETEIMEVLGR